MATTLNWPKKCISAKGFIITAPEYNGSVPPSLNNAIAWISRTGEDWRQAFNEKTVVLATHSGGGGTKVLEAMRMQMSHIGANCIGRTLLTNYNKPLNHDSAIAILAQLDKLSRA